MLLRFGTAKLAEAGYVARVNRRYVMRGSEAVAKRALPLGSPHDAVDVVGAGIVFDQAGEEIPVVRIIHAQRVGIASVQIALLNFLDVRQVGAEDVFEPADHFHATLFGGRQHFGQDVQIAVVRGARVFEDRVLVVLRMRRGEVAAVKIEIVFLLAVIGQRLSGNLPSGDAATVGEHGKKQRIHAGTFLEGVENFLGAFIDE